ncbi:hypothetical protein BX666DRAFT_1872893, partial [Dichotomocladium elegans]
FGSMLRIIVLLKDNIILFKPIIFKGLHKVTLQYFAIQFGYVSVQCFIHIAINFAHPTHSAIRNSTPQHDAATTTFDCLLDMMTF